ncbi:MAG: hypothetical protein CL579_11540 [Alteromonadaceae bacterium]|jgi:hypothetical protein|uniref:Uncharacterized protein n=2 Tax=Paraglaciecola mesophila TaxID=197222 RepID=K6XRJ2_9ALTE|nr:MULTISPECIES: hypothetical protein [Paraglaciecola]ABG39671.1 conserved hypothetical protein [Paraglaciecola sp. T6c]MAD16692.1 hypothetical protein [Alteromonadaceae bacterium]MBB20294.1 hypothetical protein [Rickettsiales bacterium]GAC23239.1 hypothetical protein GMES_0940 [Paraglaciecola mesophila KMM 241]|tara:strand:- start:630 stop:959 length:330 start_codon:yes stop_codon:yes gene_type:complete|eukprot:TRINITY_DN14985_c0_g1_i1.p1 TRINITY_DN14985_c0_g1~~TRINITY_DN14985_c0_g1_i1.p1  ORF type:complete len:110 (+),score=19.59 TRINITY_DN14985_c0_g1_i1:594-923(+)
MTEKPFLVSGRNTLIHKIRKLDLLVTNGEDNPAIIVSHKSIKEFTGTIPDNKREAKQQDMELVDVTVGDVFGEEKTLLFIQTINGKEYKIDYSKHGTPLFIKIHQDNAF